MSLRTQISKAAVAETIPRIGNSERSFKVHSKPDPSVVQKIPKVVRIKPTTNFMVFSGTLVKGLCKKKPEAITKDDFIEFNNKYILRKGLSASYQNQVVNALKLFYQTIFIKIESNIFSCLLS